VTDTPHNIEAIAERIRQARRLAGKTQEEAARELGVTVRTFARWETAETTGFLQELDRIGEALGVTRAQLVDAAPVGLDARLEAIERELAALRAAVERLTPAPATS
jgi:transcriptional regulator with XRE-family HTH domain